MKGMTKETVFAQCDWGLTAYLSFVRHEEEDAGSDDGRCPRSVERNVVRVHVVISQT